MQFLKDLSVLILGLGESGTACAKFAYQCGANVRVVDNREQAPGLDVIHALQQQGHLHGHLDCLCAAFDPAMLDGVDQLIISPGLSPQRADIAAMLNEATDKGIPVYSEIDWFYSALQELAHTHNYTPKILAVTGTNGKTTVVELCTHLCQHAGMSAKACGNISPSALDALMDSLEQGTLPQVWVVELSSFQLHYTQRFVAHAGVVLNISQDHLDWHLDMAQYMSDKAKLFTQDTQCIVNRDDALVLAMLPVDRKHHSFGMGAPAQLDDLGLVEDGALIWLAQAVLAQPGVKLKKHQQPELLIKRLMPADALRLRGGHNHTNALAALLLVKAAGVGIAQALHGLRSFEVAPNRCELISILNDVEYINDSKGTNVGATVAALQGLGESRSRIVLLAGGVGKGQDFAPLATAVATQCAAVVVFGQDAGLIKQALSTTQVPIYECDTLEQATHMAAGLAKTGQAVLMSPACASFDQFKNYQHRADVFRQCVQSIAFDQGSIA